MDDGRDSDSDSDSYRNRKLELSSDVVKGAGPGRRFGTGGRYEITSEFAGGKSKSTVMIVDKQSPGARTKEGAPVKTPVIRFDRPHVGAEFPHVNINPKISGRPDPHYRVPSSVVEAAPFVGKVLRGANKAAVPAALAMDGHRLYSAYEADKESGDQDYTRTKTEAVGVAGGWLGAAAGGRAGAEIGTQIFPGVGTIAGGVLGGIAGAIAGDAAGRAVGDRVTRNSPTNTEREGEREREKETE